LPIPDKTNLWILDKNGVLTKIAFFYSTGTVYICPNFESKSCLGTSKNTIFINMKEIHEKTYTHLREKYPDLRFTLRKIDKGGRLRKGYWFIGNENSLAFSFWQGMDRQNMTPNIIFIIHLNGGTTFEFIDRDNGKKRTFFEQIAKPLKMLVKLQIDEGIAVRWSRLYSQPDTDYIKSLDDFINNEKVLIDTFISFNGNLLPPIDELSFKNSLDKIEKYRQSVPIINPVKVTQPIRIQRLSLINITHFDNLEITLHPRVTCFIGENGSGKTTILRAIVFGLIGFSNTAFVREDIEKLKYELNNFLKIEKAQNDQYDYAANGEITLFYNQNKKNSIKFHPLSEGVDENGALRRTNSVEIDDSESDFDVLDDSGHFKNLVIAFSQIKSDDNGSSKSQNEKDKTKSSLRAIHSLLYNQRDLSFSNVQDWIAQSFSSNYSENERKHSIAVLKKAFELMSEITGQKIELGDMNPEKKVVPLIKTPDAPNGIPLDLVSQGYENLIGWVGYLVKRLAEVTPDGQDFTQTPAICFIDEIDAYLHPKWQRNLLKVLVDSFPKVQFIVTTHSPQVVMNLKKENVIRIENGKANQNLFVEGRDANALSTDIFGLPKRLPAFEQLLDEIHELIDKDEKEKAEAKINDLKQKWGEADVDLHRAQMYLSMI
jgi:predicted ATP-binding protein involved in virulence